MEVNRRTLLATASAASAAALLGVPGAVLPAAAQTAPAGKQAPGYYRYKVGDYEITAVTDGAATFPLPDRFVQNKDKGEVQKALEEAFRPTDMLTVPFTPIVINTGSKLVLIDSGMGPAMHEKSKGAIGQLHTNLAAASINLKSVDTVILSHLHPDHINGIRTADGGLAFPNAEIMVPGADWAFWMSDENAAKATSDLMKGYFANARRVLGDLANKVTRYDAGKEVAPGITAMATPGHTPGHSSFTVSSGKSSVLVQSDVTNIPHLFLRNPSWQVMFDVDPLQAAETRKKFYDIASADRLMVQGFHFPFPSVGHVERDGDRYRLIPAPWNPVI
jgi:glyoxylase-like metal-dependent hydrolase (beta-lactamase superfamily II)